MTSGVTTTPESELAAVERWVKESNNDCGCGCKDWHWDSELKILSITEEDGQIVNFEGDMLADSSDDPRLQHLRK
jgi:hypothetical protein